jgi:hypothetical protein
MGCLFYSRVSVVQFVLEKFYFGTFKLMCKKVSDKIRKVWRQLQICVENVTASFKSQCVKRLENVITIQSQWKKLPASG